MPAHSPHEQREISHNKFRDHTVIHQGNVQGNVYYGVPHPAARAEVVRVIPYPRNEDLVHRPDLINKLDELLPPTPGSRSAALWGLGGSGNDRSKTQIALDYAYRRCDADKECCIFWVHAGNEATFLADYKAIGKKLGVDQWLDGTDLLDAVRNEIEGRSNWVMILDNADDLRLFGVGRQAQKEGTNENVNLKTYIPCSMQGTVLWTSRDGHVVGTLISARHSVEVRSMAVDEATTLLTRIRDKPSTMEEALREEGVAALLYELQCLPLAISQAGAYMRRMSMTAEEYLRLLRQGKTRWEVLKASDADRHRRPEVSNSVLETWRISTERIRAESEMSYLILHVVAYIDGQDIPQELVAAAAGRYFIEDGASAKQALDLEFLEAIARLKEFSFLNLRQTYGSERRYEMHKLVQEAVRYGVRIRDLAEADVDNALRTEVGLKAGEAYYSGVALQIIDGAFPPSEPSSWARCEQYLTHAIRVGEWAEMSRTEIETSTLLERVSDFLYDRGRWREREWVDTRAWSLRQKVLGEKHPDTIKSMADLAATYHAQGRHDEDEKMAVKVLDFRRDVLGEKHPDTIASIASLAVTYHMQGRYNEAERLKHEALNLQREVLGERDPDTSESMASLATTYHAQNRHNEAEKLKGEVLELRREVLGDKHPDTIWSMASLATTYNAQGQYKEAEGIYQEVLELQREVLGDKHPDTIWSMSSLATTYHAQNRHNEAEKLKGEVLELRREVLGDKHPDTIWSMASLATTYHAQNRHNEAEKLKGEVLELHREVLGDRHPDTIWSMASLATTYNAQGQYKEAEGIYQEVLELQREVLGEKHPDTISSMASLAAMYHRQGQYDEDEEISVKVLELRREVLGEKHPDTIWSMSSLATTYHAQNRHNEAEKLRGEVLELQQEVLGEKHPDTIWGMSSLATTYHAQGQYYKAECIDREALDLRREVLGEMHPDTIWSIAELALTYYAQNRHDEAEKLRGEVLELRRELLGEKHPDTIMSMVSLGLIYHAQGRYEKDEEISAKALDLRREVLGERHPYTISSMSNLATAYYKQGRYNEAESIDQKVLELRREVLGEWHPYTITSMANLATTYYAQGQYNKAERLHRTALDLRRHVLGENHPNTIQSMEYLVLTQEALQQPPSLTESVQSLAITKADGMEAGNKPGRKPLWTVVRRKAEKLRNSRSSRK
ncbi:hypothetical protein FDENT_1166 [Fusarium denticulatum]|uniref:NB-ARC domain-containing protein n=1 Tax=Fusarium denticulatum TaxID=48507 RepID=A0A8H6CW94_9HYPO|nr:hypothetical protein FDENT_1166 [Fusarium denticulatum]